MFQPFFVRFLEFFLQFYPYFWQNNRMISSFFLLSWPKTFLNLALLEAYHLLFFFNLKSSENHWSMNGILSLMIRQPCTKYFYFSHEKLWVDNIFLKYRIFSISFSFFTFTSICDFESNSDRNTSWYWSLIFKKILKITQII